MKPLEACDLLSAWEKGLNQTPLQRSLILLGIAYPGTSPLQLEKLSIGQRDQQLLRLRENLFGPGFSSTAVCPNCNERLEWEDRVERFRTGSDEEILAEKEFQLDEEAYFIRFRLPNSLDVEKVNSDASPGTAPQQLLLRCLIEARCSGEDCDFSDLPASVIDSLEQEIESLDPQADVQISLNCPACSHHWVVMFDIAAYLWKEINAWAGQMLKTICRLAAAYGWSEQEILRISPVRRQLYLGMLG